MGATGGKGPDFGNAARAGTRQGVAGATQPSFGQGDDHGWRRLRRFLVRRHGWNLPPGRAAVRTNDWFQDQGLYRLCGTIRYPGAG